MELSKEEMIYSKRVYMKQFGVPDYLANMVKEKDCAILMQQYADQEIKKEALMKNLSPKNNYTNYLKTQTMDKEIPQEIMDKIGALCDGATLPYDKGSLMEYVIDGYHLRDQEVEEWYNKYVDETWEREKLDQLLQQKGERIKELEDGLKELLSYNNGIDENGDRHYTSTGIKIKKLLNK